MALSDTRLSFSPETGLSTPSTADIRAKVAAMFVSAFQKDDLPPLNTEPETPAGQLIDSLSAIIADKNAEILYLSNMFNPLTSEGVWQAALGQIYFLTPKTSTRSVAICTCMGMQGTVIADGSIIQSTVDNTQWVALSTKTIPSGGTVDIEFQCTSDGAVTAGAGTLTRIVTVTSGWDTVSNGSAAVVGTLAETQRAFELRRYNSVAANARGSVLAIYGAIAKLDGVTDLVVLENTSNATLTKHGVKIPGHSIYVTVFGGLDTDIAEAIYRKKDAGCGTAGNTTIEYQDDDTAGSPTYQYQIERPASVAFGIQVTLRKTPLTPDDIDSSIKAALIKDFNGKLSNARVGTAQTVYASRFYCPAISAGASDLLNIQICFPASGQDWSTSVVVNADQEPTLAAADITVIKLD